MKIKQVLIIQLVLICIAYIAGTIAYADFNIVNWGSNYRIHLSVGYIFVSIFSLLFAYIALDANKQNDK